MLKSVITQSSPLPQFLHQSQEVLTDTNPETVYYDIVITNLQSVDTRPPVLYYNESRNNPFLQCSGDYEISIIRFQLDTFTTLPVFIPTIQPNQPQIDLSVYSITLEYNDGVNPTFTSGQTFLQWIPQDLQDGFPSPPSSNPNGIQDENTSYYNAYSLQWLIFLVDKTMTTAYNALVVNILAGGGVVPTDSAKPFLSWDTTNNIAVINAVSSVYNRSLPNPILMYFNSALYSLFSSFVSRYEGYDAPLGKNFLIIIDDFSSTSTIQLPINIPPPPPVITPVIYTQVFQECSTINSWCPISSVVFCSNTLPIVSNQLSAPLVFNNLSQFTSGTGNNSNFAQVLTDFTTGDNSYQPYILYNPTAEYRMVSMYGNNPLTNIDLSVFWKTKFGALIPLRLASGASCSIKIMFRKKANLAIGKSVGYNLGKVLKG